jgi:ATP-dependent DNA ligase
LANNSFPEWYEPMAATLTQERFSGPEWLFERKFDGIRMLAFKNGRDVKLYSRNRLLQDYPSVAAAIAQVPVHDVILDGEAAWDPSSRIAYHVFDILWLNGRPLISAPLEERRTLLKSLPLSTPLARVPEVHDEKPWEAACRKGWEGVIAKLRSSPYEHRRSPYWLKMKCEASQELVVGGFTDPQGSRVGLGALLVGYFEAKDFTFAGKIGTGFNRKLLLDLRQLLDGLKTSESPFTKGTGFPRLRVHWVKPEVVVQVAFTEWTVHGKLRHARLIGIRHDKTALEVRRES